MGFLILILGLYQTEDIGPDWTVPDTKIFRNCNPYIRSNILNWFWCYYWYVIKKSFYVEEMVSTFPTAKIWPEVMSQKNIL